MAAILLALLGLVALATSIPSPTPPQNSSAFSDPPLLSNKPAADVEQFLRDMVNKINRYRLMHAASPLGLSLELTNKAELWAVKIANKDQEELNSNVTFGQAIYSSVNTGDIVNASVESWYNQIVHYRYYNPEAQPQNNYFTQLVWKDTTDIGIGKATSGSQKTYIVAYFNPPAVHDMQSMLLQVHPVTGSGVGKNGPSQCTDDYKFFNNSCWKLFPGPRTWESAVHKCTQQYASLASVDSESENYFVKTLLTTARLNYTWIGLGDHDNDGIFAWVDGTSHRYTRWDYYQTPAKGRPCVVLGLDFEWRYISCDKGQSFVCKRKLRDLTTYELTFRYMNKLWTDKLLSPSELRYQALKSHIENAIFETYREADWFNGLDFRGFRRTDQDKIEAIVRISFTPDDDAPIDPIELLRNKLQGASGNTQKRATIRGVLFGEPVELVKVELIIDQQPNCPNYCIPQQCQPVACNPSCCHTQYGSSQSYMGYLGGQRAGYPGYPYQRGYIGYYGNQGGYQGYRRGNPGGIRYSSYSGYPGYARSYPRYPGYSRYPTYSRYPGYAGYPGYNGYSGSPLHLSFHDQKPKPSEKKSKQSKDDLDTPPPVETPSKGLQLHKRPQQNSYQQYLQSYYQQYRQNNPYYQRMYQYNYPQSYPQGGYSGYGTYQSYNANNGYSNPIRKHVFKRPPPPPPPPKQTPQSYSDYSRYTQGYPQGYPQGYTQYPQQGYPQGYTQGYPQYGYGRMPSSNPYQYSGTAAGYQYSLNGRACIGDCLNSCAPQCPQQCCARSHVRPHPIK